jgi:Ni,Fe-hydrogenase III small subunit
MIKSLCVQSPRHGDSILVCGWTNHSRRNPHRRRPASRPAPAALAARPAAHRALRASSGEQANVNISTLTIVISAVIIVIITIITAIVIVIIIIISAIIVTATTTGVGVVTQPRAIVGCSHSTVACVGSHPGPAPRLGAAPAAPPPPPSGLRGPPPSPAPPHPPPPSPHPPVIGAPQSMIKSLCMQLPRHGDLIIVCGWANHTRDWRAVHATPEAPRPNTREGRERGDGSPASPPPPPPPLRAQSVRRS